jgi:signal transduction histidine kinase
MRHFFIFLIVNSVFLLHPSFSQESVVNASIPPVRPVPTNSVGGAGTTDSLKKARRLVDEKRFKEALKIALPTLDQAKARQDLKLVYETNDFIANLFIQSNNYDTGITYLKNNLEILVRFPDNLKFANLCNKISAQFFKIQNTDSAEVYLNKVIGIKQNSREIETAQAKAYSNLSGLQVQKKKLSTAVINAQKALEIHQKHHNNISIAFALNSLGSVYMSQHKYVEAKKVFLEALSILSHEKTSKELTSLSEVLYDNLSYTLFQLKDYRAYTYQEKSIDIRDSIRDAEMSGILAEIEGKYNTENVKKEALLKAAEEKVKLNHTQDLNTILTIISLALLAGSWLLYRYLKLRQEKLKLEFNQNKLLQQSVLEKIQNESREKILNATIDGKESERKMIAETLHHSVSSLLSSAGLHLQAGKILLKGDSPLEIEKAQNIIKEASEKIRNLSHSLVSTVLLKFGLKYSIQDMCEKYSNSSISFECDCEEIERFSLDFELKINSIIDELLNNVIKHSHANHTIISLKEYKGYLEIYIKDNGKGFNPKEQRLQGGFGLMQIEARIKRMSGVFNIKSNVQNGTLIYISVPVEKEGN